MAAYSGLSWPDFAGFLLTAFFSGFLLGYRFKRHELDINKRLLKALEEASKASK